MKKCWLLIDLDLKMVLIPEKNKKDLVDVPKKVRDDMNIVLVNHMDQVLHLALEPALEKKERRTSRKRNHRSEERRHFAERNIQESLIKIKKTGEFHQSFLFSDFLVKFHS